MNLMKTFIDLLLEQLSRPCGDYVLSVDVATYCLVHMWPWFPASVCDDLC
jgi:hypothetical protein